MKYRLKSKDEKDGRYISTDPMRLVNPKEPNVGEWTRGELKNLYKTHSFLLQRYDEELVLNEEDFKYTPQKRKIKVC